MLNGGYLMVSKTDTELYKKLNNALTLGKPVLFYEDATTCYYIDTISKSGDDIVLTKGGKTITITDANVVTESGDIQPSESELYEHTLLLYGEKYSNKSNYFILKIYSNDNTEITLSNIINKLSAEQDKYFYGVGASYDYANSILSQTTKIELYDGPGGVQFYAYALSNLMDGVGYSSGIFNILSSVTDNVTEIL
ncbi:MAG: hypothetical protein IKT40_14425 [Bacilli bacterium]|nr:hypothetical protein [Bacilli bacterium]